MFHVMRDPAGECVAIVPLILSRRRAGPLRIAFWSLLGADPAITEIRAPMVETGYELPVARALHERLDAMHHADWVQWTGMRGRMLAALSESRPMHWPAVPDELRTQPCAELDGISGQASGAISANRYVIVTTP